MRHISQLAKTTFRRNLRSRSPSLYFFLRIINTHLEKRGKTPDEGVDLGRGVKSVRGGGCGLLVLPELGVDLLHGGGEGLRLLRRLQLDHLERHQEGLHCQGEAHDGQPERLLDADPWLESAYERRRGRAGVRARTFRQRRGGGGRTHLLLVSAI